MKSVVIRQEGLAFLIVNSGLLGLLLVSAWLFPDSLISFFNSAAPGAGRELAYGFLSTMAVILGLVLAVTAIVHVLVPLVIRQLESYGDPK
jgi:hypothetical protein